MLIFLGIQRYMLYFMLKLDKMNYVQNSIFKKRFPNWPSFPKAVFGSVSLLTVLTRRDIHAVCLQIKKPA